MGRTVVRLSALALLAMAAASPAGADVKAGVDAWARGDYAAAVRNWQAPAAQGDADALFNLGQAYKLGRGVKQDLNQAENLFGKAAALGHIQASDNFGLLLFQRGERGKALPYIAAAADRGDPRAQYLLGIAHFNGDGVPKDWVRAYALTSLARQANLAQAVPAIAQMDQFIPLDQRQQGAAMAAELAEQAQATRARQLAAADLGSEASSAPVSGAGADPTPTAAIRAPRPGAVAAASPAARTPIPAPAAAVAAAARVAGSDAPQTAGADYARPAPRPAPIAAPSARLAAAPARTAPTAAPTPAPAQAPTQSAQAGGWRVQLGAFGVPGNADALWNRVKARPELAGKSRLLVPAGRVTKLQAGGFASQAEAQAACNRLEAAGLSCLATRN